MCSKDKEVVSYRLFKTPIPLADEKMPALWPLLKKNGKSHWNRLVILSNIIAVLAYAKL